MEDATIIEQDTSNVQPEATVVEQPTVVEQATPMDNNITYDNLPQDDIKIDPTKDLTQNLVQDAMHIAHDDNVISNAGNAMSNFLNKSYDYDREEAGSYWVAGGINDKDTQMSFLNTIINEEMYDEMDLQKYYYDTTMATARAYAAQKEKETAYGYYRAAQEKAISEAQLTGWYMPAEGQYMLANYEAAQTTLNDPNASDADIAKANRISGVAEQWFAANKISTRGMKCLSMMNYEENVRHNTIMGELQKQANAIAAKQAGASAASANLQLRQLKFQVEEMELQSGHNYSKEIGLDNTDTLGHDITEDEYSDFQALQGFKEKAWKETEVQEFGNHDFTPQQLDDYIKGMEEDGWKFDEDKMEFTREVIKSSKPIDQLLSNTDYYAAILTARGKSWMDNTLKQRGKDPQQYYNKYQADLGDTGLKESVTNNGNILDETYLNTEYWKVSADSKYKDYNDKTIYSFHTNEDGKPVTKCYVKDNDGVFHQITDKNIKLQQNGTLADKVTNFSSTVLKYDGNEIQVGKAFNTGSQAASVANNWSGYSNLNNNGKMNDHAKKIQEYENKGYIWLSSKHGDSGLFDVDAGTVMYNPEKNEYITISDIVNKVEVKKSSDIKEVKQPNWKVGSTFYENGGGNYKYMMQNSEKIGETTFKDKYGDEHTTKVYMFIDGNGKDHYYMLGKEGSTDKLTNDYTIISKEKAKEVNPNIESKVDAMNNYRANIKVTSTDTITGKNQDAMEQEASNKYKEDHKDDNTSNSSGSTGGDPTRNATYDAQNTVDSEQAEYKEYVSRMEKEGIPKAEILSYNDWREGKTTINVGR